MNGVVVGAEVFGAVVCAVLFALAITGGNEFSAWERGNLNRVAIFSGVGAVALCGLIVWHFL